MEDKKGEKCFEKILDQAYGEDTQVCGMNDYWAMDSRQVLSNIPQKLSLTYSKKTRKLIKVIHSAIRQLTACQTKLGKDLVPVGWAASSKTCQGDSQGSLKTEKILHKVKI